MEYAAILLLLKKRRKPKYSIDAGLKKMFNNGDATQPLQGRTRPGSGGPSSPTSAAALEDAKRTVIFVAADRPHSLGISKCIFILRTLNADNMYC